MTLSLSIRIPQRRKEEKRPKKGTMENLLGSGAQAWPWTSQVQDLYLLLEVLGLHYLILGPGTLLSKVALTFRLLSPLDGLVKTLYQNELLSCTHFNLYQTELFIKHICTSLQKLHRSSASYYIVKLHTLALWTLQM